MTARYACLFLCCVRGVVWCGASVRERRGVSVCVGVCVCVCPLRTEILVDCRRKKRA